MKSEGDGGSNLSSKTSKPSKPSSLGSLLWVPCPSSISSSSSSSRPALPCPALQPRSPLLGRGARKTLPLLPLATHQFTHAQRISRGLERWETLGACPAATAGGNVLSSFYPSLNCDSLQPCPTMTASQVNLPCEMGGHRTLGPAYACGVENRRSGRERALSHISHTCRASVNWATAAKKEEEKKSGQWEK